jgi:hypothetical protein
MALLVASQISGGFERAALHTFLIDRSSLPVFGTNLLGKVQLHTETLSGFSGPMGLIFKTECHYLLPRYFHEEKPLTMMNHTLNPANLNIESERRDFEIREPYITVDRLY